MHVKAPFLTSIEEFADYIIHNKVVVPVNEAQERLLEFQDHIICSQVVPSHPSYVKWIAPVERHFKINFDGVTFEVSNMTGIGVVIHNHKGLVIAALTQKILLPHYVDVVEALAAKSCHFVL